MADSALVDWLVDNLVRPPHDGTVGESLPGSAPYWGLDPHYADFLRRSHGGYTPDYLFHYFGATGGTCHQVGKWNEPALWKADFGLGSQDYVFAEDILGNQYYFYHRPQRKVVKMLEIERGRVIVCATDFVSFLRNNARNEERTRLLQEFFEGYLDYSRQTYEPFHHLSWKVPLCLGGTDKYENIELIQSLANLKVLGQLLRQVGEKEKDKNQGGGARSS